MRWPARRQSDFHVTDRRYSENRTTACHLPPQECQHGVSIFASSPGSHRNESQQFHYVETEPYRQASELGS